MIKKILATALVPLAALAAVTPAEAQTESEKPKKKDSWVAVVDLAFSGASGNDRTVLLTSGFSIRHLHTEHYEMEFSGSVRYGKSEGREVARNLKSGIKLDLMPRERWSPFFTINAERDPFRKLELRSNSGAGVKYTFWREKRGNASISVAGLHSYEQLTPDAADLIDGQHSARWSWRFKGVRRFNGKVNVENTTFYQPVWDRLDEYLLTTDTSVRVPMSRRISLTLRHTYDRDSVAPVGVHKDDHLVRAGLTIESRW